jgi:hypothetical protein
MKNKVLKIATATLLLNASLSPVFAGSAPVIGGGAVLQVSVGEAGIVNATGAMAGQAIAKQAVGSMLSGKVTGELTATVEVGEAGVVNAGGAVDGKALIAQSVGSMVSGTVAGAVNTDVLVGQAGIVNAGGAAAGSVVACQAVGSIGNDCSDAKGGNDQ